MARPSLTLQYALHMWQASFAILPAVTKPNCACTKSCACVFIGRCKCVAAAAVKQPDPPPPPFLSLMPPGCRRRSVACRSSMSGMQHKQQWHRLQKCSSGRRPSGCGGSPKPGAPNPSHAKTPSTRCQTPRAADPSRKSRLTLDRAPWPDRSVLKQQKLFLPFVC